MTTNSYALIDANSIVAAVVLWDGVEFNPGQPGITAVAYQAAQPEIPAVPPDENGEGGSPAIPAVPEVQAVEGQPAIPAFGWSPPDGLTAVMVTDETGSPMIGLAFENGVFEQPAPVVVVPPTPAEVTAANAATLASRLNEASVAISPLQLAISLGEATDAETASAKAWVAYTRELKAIDLTQASIAWPDVPAN